ncbi:MAG: molybdopterin molybdotransferase MoeA [Candidatus Nitrospinota bacterium M3_3B_026]
MISIEEAGRIIARTITPTTVVESVPLARAFGRILAVDTVSDIDIPPFDRATMDGYAVVSSDGAGEREVIEYIPAGARPVKTVTSGKAARVMTGAPVPEGADAVIQVEKTGGFVDIGREALIKEAPAPCANIAPRGEDLKAGDTALRAGTILGPAQAAALAMAGVDPVPVFRAPRVAVLSTGDELVPPGSKPGHGQIRDSNGFSLMAQAVSLGAEASALGIAGDDEEELYSKIMTGMEYDFLIVSGGVSAGDRDFAVAAMERAGYRTLFHKIKIKPGKPALFGVNGNGGYVFGVPGNPVSAMVIFELFIKPAIRRFAGAPYERGLRVHARLENGFKRGSGAREEYVPAFVTGGAVLGARLLPYHGSGHIHALAGANALARIPGGVTKLDAGANVEAIIL